jgi:hypothetical protein
MELTIGSAPGGLAVVDGNMLSLHVKEEGLSKLKLPDRIFAINEGLSHEMDLAFDYMYG